MTNTKPYWIVIPLSIVLAGSVVINIMAWRYFKAMETWNAATEIQNAQFRAEKLTRLRNHLSNGEFEKAQALTEQLYGIEISLLEQMQQPGLFPESVKQRAKTVLTEIETNFNESSKEDEQPLD